MTANGQGRRVETATASAPDNGSPSPASGHPSTESVAPAGAATAAGTLPPPPLDEVVAVTEALVPLLGGAAVSRIAISTGTVSWEIEAAVPPAGTAPALGPVAGAAPATGEAQPAGPPPAQRPGQPAGHDVTAPLVGVFYRAKSPGAPPFVEPGDHVSVGQQLAIVEAMKMMNEVVADRAGRVRQIHPPDGSVVEFGQPLVSLEVDR